jgi:hypothetical protein
MNPGEIKNATRALGAPESWDKDRLGECSTLPIRDTSINGSLVMQSAWYPTREEIEAMCLGEPVILTIYGRSHPPVSLHVAEGEKQ